MKKDSNIVKKIHPILRYETEACAEYLEKMAAKGLFIKSINNYVFCFEKTEPRKVKFYIDAFERASWFDTRAEEETLDYKEYCERAGWNYVCTEGKFQVFYTEDMEAVSIETDLNKRLKTILNGAMYQAVIHPLFIIAMMCMMMFNPVRLYFVRPNELIELNYPLLGVLVLWFLLGMFAIFKLLDTVRFWISNKISIAKNNCMKIKVASTGANAYLCSEELSKLTFERIGYYHSMQNVFEMDTTDCGLSGEVKLIYINYKEHSC